MSGNADLDSVLEQLTAFEPLFHRSRVAMSRDEFDAMVDQDFWEIGASGVRYTRDHVQSVVEGRRLRGDVNDAAELGWTVDRSAVRRIADDTYLVTYRLTQADRVTERSSIWRITENRWSVLFHQGTVVESDPDE